MKRPQGFERPAQPRQAAPDAAQRKAQADARPTAPPASNESAARRRRADGASRRPSTAAPGAGSDPASASARTERIEPLRAQRPLRASDPHEDSERPVGADTAAGTAGADPIGAASVGAETARATSAPPSGTPGGWAARRALAKATRARRRYERAEVRRFTVRSRRRRLAWGVSLGAVGLLVVAVLIGAYSPIMALRDVRVEGASRVQAADVAAAFEPMLGTPLALVDRASVQEAMSGFPLIETYQTEAVPPGTLVVRIVERTPVGVIETDDGLALVDAAGVVMDRPESRPEGQPLITVDGGVSGDGFRAVASVVRALPADVRAQVTAASAETADDVTLQVGDAKVVWGSAEESGLKADVLAALLAAAPPGSVSLYDVSAPTSPVTM
ncbi:cell division protein FtsQ [Agromyces sp. CF514]|uniref:FtsQ-type POTRA domain-containing protein n=1 Tax=Agromyces sp. CF514 TaxID=1881031 RepID=UPI0008ED3BF0|nr:FtsQ-type POTRA domain-containing protein [Agromyces sp. CF514]SFR79040.1 cell division protein FtsQ [Agromyces sp. CF514]